MKGVALVVEDREDWRKDLADLLEQGGFEVKTAATQEEAMSILRSENLHLVIVDISLRRENDSDESGMTLLDAIKELKLDQVVRTIVVSAYGTRQRMRRAFVDYSVDDFIAKDEFDSAEFLDIVEEVFRTKARVNPDLVILPESLDYAAMFVNMFIGGRRIRRSDGDEAQAFASEVHDLLRKLFHRASSIVVAPMTKGYSGAGVIQVKAVYPDSGVGTPVVVKFGDREQIGRENENFTEHVKEFIGQGRRSSLIDVRCTTHLGGIVYSFLGTDVEQLTSFEDYYASHSAAEINEVLADLFDVTTANWYANRSPLGPMNLVDEYLQAFGFANIDELENSVFQGKLKRYHDQVGGLQIPEVPDVELPHPVEALRSRDFVYFTTQCITHGDLNANNILVDEEGRTWLIDYHRTGRSHILRDCIELESVIKYMLLQSEEIDQLYLLERCLSQVSSFAQVTLMEPKLQGADDEVQKAYSAVRFIRQVAHRLATVHRAGDFGEYQVALAINSLNIARHLSLPPLQRLHALMGASLALRSVL